MYKKLLSVILLLVSLAWQPGHHYLMAAGMSMSSEVHSLVNLMAAGMSMSSEVHSLVTMFPFLAILLFLIK